MVAPQALGRNAEPKAAFLLNADAERRSLWITPPLGLDVRISSVYDSGIKWLAKTPFRERSEKKG
jgi:hypothetical protein